MQASLIIPAAGSGVRFNRGLAGKRRKSFEDTLPGLGKDKTRVSKLFYPVCGVPLLVYTLQAFQNISEIKEIIVAAQPDVAKLLYAWKKEYGWKKLKCVRGGKTRFESVLNGLKHSSPAYAWTLVHDGARPLVAEKSVRRLLAAAHSGKADGYLLGKKVVPTIKLTGQQRGAVLRTLDRDFLYEAETPQLARRSVLMAAYRAVGKKTEGLTDEASILERTAKSVRIVEHDSWNPKITTVSDFEMMEAYLKYRRPEPLYRTGFGSDLHRLVDGRKFYLGGILIPSNRGPLGHSDGDALLHAVIDALLGATGKGDIGEHFSDRKAKYKNIRSETMLRSILDLIRKEGWTIENVDTVVHLEEPRLGPYKEKIKKKMSAMLGIDPGCISVKAKTFEKLEQPGRAVIQCEAAVMMKQFVL